MLEFHCQHTGSERAVGSHKAWRKSAEQSIFPLLLPPATHPSPSLSPSLSFFQLSSFISPQPSLSLPLNLSQRGLRIVSYFGGSGLSPLRFLGIVLLSPQLDFHLDSSKQVVAKREMRAPVKLSSNHASFIREALDLANPLLLFSLCLSLTFQLSSWSFLKHFAVFLHSVSYF